MAVGGPKIVNLRIVKGDDYTYSGTVKQSDDVTAQNITGWALKFVAAATPSGVAVVTKTVGSGITITNGAAGLYTLTLTDDDTDSLGDGYVYSVRRTDAGNETTVTTGTINVDVVPQ